MHAHRGHRPIPSSAFWENRIGTHRLRDSDFGRRNTADLDIRLKLEGGLIGAIRASRERRQMQNPTAGSTDASETVPHCPVCNALMVKRLARRGVSAGSTFWGCCNYPKRRGTRAG
jgi:hypothetical protein